MQISFLNLDRSTDRLATFLAWNSHLTDLHRISATDGCSYSRSDLRSVGVLDGNMSEYTNGAIGNALSHFGEWERASKGSEVLTLAEDDAVFHRDFESLATKTLAKLPPDWDFILWGWNFDSILSFDLLPGVSSCVALFDQASLRTNVTRYREMPLQPVPYRLNRAFGVMCQSISPSGAAKLLKHCIPIRPMQTYYPLLNRIIRNGAVDHMMNALYPQINAYVCVPPLAVTENDHAISTVQTASAG